MAWIYVGFSPEQWDTGVSRMGYHWPGLFVLMLVVLAWILLVRIHVLKYLCKE